MSNSLKIMLLAALIAILVGAVVVVPWPGARLVAGLGIAGAGFVVGAVAAYTPIDDEEM
ncbi:Uncharacterised protein [Actinobaculum suis]|uniref:Uncharacterized protein n=1 Tax=Actinobaculum suis TaxID=1657 RepID=A0A7Z8Y9R6_9ACTO|nr:hypothetical protein [Actinobaculum suis]VDG76921.1 Uncharacterised protein [Actinobaculum suis]